MLYRFNRFNQLQKLKRAKVCLRLLFLAFLLVRFPSRKAVQQHSNTLKFPKDHLFTYS